MGRFLVTCRVAAKAEPYARALVVAGVDPQEIRVAAAEGESREESASALLHGMSGLLLSGGGDLEPHHYGEAPIAGLPTDPPSPERDVMELELFALARERRLPILAICRGLQLANVALGGSLWQDLPAQTGASGHDFPVSQGFALDHPAHPVAGNGLRGPMPDWLARQNGRPVNSRHHQAVRRPAEKLSIVATSADGVVEAMTSTDPDGWLWGVQWHPENLLADAAQRALFTEFRAACEGAAR